MTSQATWVCRLTPTGRGAVAVVGVAGSQAVAAVNQHFKAANGQPLTRQSLARILYGQWRDEDLVVCRTGADEVEVHCHGGRWSVASILEDLVASGCVEIDWPEWVSQHSACPLAGAAQQALAEAVTSRTAAVLLDQFHGALSRELAAVQCALGDGHLAEAARRLEQLIERADVGLHLTVPWRVVIAGRPNVGKSSLINRLLGYQRAIVFDEPGTTRDVVSATTAVAGWPIELSDTAGLQETTNEVERAGVSLAQAQLQQADLVVWVLAMGEFELVEYSQWLKLAQHQAAQLGAQVDWNRALVAANKVDLLSVSERAQLDVMAVSATSPLGIDRLLESLAERLVPEVPEAGTAVPFTVEQVELLSAARAACERQEVEAALAAIACLMRGCDTD